MLAFVPVPPGMRPFLGRGARDTVWLCLPCAWTAAMARTDAYGIGSAGKERVLACLLNTFCVNDQVRVACTLCVVVCCLPRRGRSWLSCGAPPACREQPGRTDWASCFVPDGPVAPCMRTASDPTVEIAQGDFHAGLLHKMHHSNIYEDGGWGLLQAADCADNSRPAGPVDGK